MRRHPRRCEVSVQDAHVLLAISNGQHHFHISHDIHIPLFCFTFDTPIFSPHVRGFMS